MAFFNLFLQVRGSHSTYLGGVHKVDTDQVVALLEIALTLGTIHLVNSSFLLQPPVTCSFTISCRANFCKFGGEPRTRHESHCETRAVHHSDLLSESYNLTELVSISP